MIYLLFFLFTFLVLFLAFYNLQHLMVFTPTYHRNIAQEEGYQFLSVITDDGVELEGVCATPSQNLNSTILFFAGRSHDSVGLIMKLSQAYPSSRIITFNYRSYGKSKGKISEKKLLSDGLKIASLVQKNYGDFTLIGFSLGSVVASYIATKHSVLALILIGTFDSFTLLVQKKFKLSLALLLRYKFDVIEYVKNIDSPTYIFASVDDEITYISNTRNLVKSVKKLALYEELQGLSHKELLWDERVTNTIKKLIEKNG